MTQRSDGVTSRLLASLLKDQRRRSERERKMSYSQKLRIVDRLMRERRKGQVAGTGLE